jgi:hypothetical protein
MVSEAEHNARGGADMIVEVRLISESWLWGWEIRTAPGGDLVESGWDSTWSAYGTAEEARAAGARRLAELDRAGAPPPRQTGRAA